VLVRGGKKGGKLVEKKEGGGGESPDAILFAYKGKQKNKTGKGKKKKGRRKAGDFLQPFKPLRSAVRGRKKPGKKC